MPDDTQDETLDEVLDETLDEVLPVVEPVAEPEEPLLGDIPVSLTEKIQLFAVQIDKRLQYIAAPSIELARVVADKYFGPNKIIGNPTKRPTKGSRIRVYVEDKLAEGGFRVSNRTA